MMTSPDFKCVYNAFVCANEQFKTEYCQLSDYNFWEMIRDAKKDNGKAETTLKWVKLMLASAVAEIASKLAELQEREEKDKSARYHVAHYRPILLALLKCCYVSISRLTAMTASQAISALEAVAVLFENKHLEMIPIGIQLALQSTEHG